MDFELYAGDLSIIRKRKMIENIEVSLDFCAKIIYVTSGFVELCNKGGKNKNTIYWGGKTLLKRGGGVVLPPLLYASFFFCLGACWGG